MKDLLVESPVMEGTHVLFRLFFRVLHLLLIKFTSSTTYCTNKIYNEASTKTNWKSNLP